MAHFSQLRGSLQTAALIMLIATAALVVGACSSDNGSKGSEGRASSEQGGQENPAGGKSNGDRDDGDGGRGDGGRGDGGRGDDDRDDGRGSGGTGGDGEISNRLACPGTQVPEGFPTCREHSDCAGQQCVWDVLDYSGVCGACFAPPRECQSDEDCTGETVCKSVPPDGCTCASEWGTVCRPACSSQSCEDGETCGSDGHCKPIACTDGYTCPAGRVCTPGRSYVDGHGCAPERCDLDGLACDDHEVCSPDTVTPEDGCVAANCNDGDYTCPTGKHCESSGGDAHGCVLDPCQSDDECAVNERCDPESSVAQENGCARLTCEVDSDCDCGVCLQGHCSDRLLICQPWPPA